MTDNIIASLAGAVLALLFGYAPGVRQWYEALEPTRKALVMAGALLIAALLLSGHEDDWTVRKGGIWWFGSRDRGGRSETVLRAVINPDFT